MQSIDLWLAEYGESHQPPTNKLIHWICVPAIVFSVIGLLWSLPVPGAFKEISSDSSSATASRVASRPFSRTCSSS